MIRRFAALAGLALLVPASAEAANPRPKTILALRVWKGASEGSYRLRKSIRVVVLRRLLPAASLDGARPGGGLRRLTGRRVRVRRLFGRRKLRRGDIRLLLRARDRRVGNEGYRLRSGAASTSAPHRNGRVLRDAHVAPALRQSYAVPRGRALDWPRYPQRGLMIDLGRRIYPQR